MGRAWLVMIQKTQSKSRTIWKRNLYTIQSKPIMRHKTWVPNHNWHLCSQQEMNQHLSQNKMMIFLSIHPFKDLSLCLKREKKIMSHYMLDYRKRKIKHQKSYKLPIAFTTLRIEEDFVFYLFEQNNKLK